MAGIGSLSVILGSGCVPGSSNSTYDHGPLEQELESAQQLIWGRLLLVG
ncbi:hypothetical protein [Ostreiculturibacter nitratireducens]